MAASAHDIDEESQALLASSDTPYNEKPVAAPSARRRFGLGHLAAAFLLGGLSSVGLQSAYTSVFLGPAGPLSAAHKAPQRFGAPWVGSTQVQPFPPASPTNTFPELFPTDVGYAGPTPTGAEPALVATAPVLPVYTQAPHLVPPVSISGGSKPKNQTKAGWDLFKHWGNLSPWYSNERGAFGIQAGGEAPEGCAVTGLHLLHRHGARYPTGWASYGGPANLAGRLHKSTNKWTAKGELEFLNDWTYKLGEEILTPFGRQQLYDLGVSIRMKYGFLLNNFTESNTIPVFRTESQDRMLASAQNFALGFFGYPIEGQYQQSITIEASNFNNTLAPYMTCPAANDRSKGDRGTYYVTKWAEKYLADARGRLDSSIDGYDISIEDTFTMQQLCAYETVAIGYSKFCELFTEEEWEGFDYALDLSFWYNSAFGSPVGRVQGIGWVQEFVARLTHTPIQTHNSSTNSTLDDDPRTFPLGQALYVDATHEVVVLNVLTALNLSTLAATGPLPADHIPKDRSFVVSRLAPFSTNVQFQQLYCPSEHTPEQIRVIVNDGVVPLSGLGACGSTHDGRCALPAFVDGLKTLIAETDWNWGCNGRWTVPQGDEWETVVGYPPAKPHSA